MHLCTVKNDKHTWSIHLRARIPASHAGHRGSNPLSTTKADNLTVVCFFLSAQLGIRQKKIAPDIWGND